MKYNSSLGACVSFLRKRRGSCRRPEGVSVLIPGATGIVGVRAVGVPWKAEVEDGIVGVWE